MIVVARQATDGFITARYDRTLCHAANAALAGSKYTALRRLSCTVSDGVVEISGTVSSFYLKQLAQAAMMNLGHGGSVRNLVEVSGESAVLVSTECGTPARVQ